MGINRENTKRLRKIGGMYDKNSSCMIKNFLVWYDQTNISCFVAILKSASVIMIPKFFVASICNIKGKTTHFLKSEASSKFQIKQVQRTRSTLVDSI